MSQKEEEFSAVMDFQKDYADQCKEQLEAEGLTVTAIIPRDIVSQYFGYVNRLIPVQKRIVKKSSTFICPVGHEAGLAELERKIIQGEDLRPHLSRKINTLGFDDGLLNDWGIHHFHLGTDLLNSGLVEGTKEVVSAFVDSEAVIFLKTVPHEWTDKEIIKPLHREFPEHIKQYRAPIQGVGHILTEEQIGEARKNGVNYFIEIDGAFYYPIGGGVTTKNFSTVSAEEKRTRKKVGLSGSSAVGQRASMNAIYWLNQMVHYEDAVKRNLNYIGSQLQGFLTENDREFHFSFSGFFEQEGPVATETKTNTRIPINDLD